MPLDLYTAHSVWLRAPFFNPPDHKLPCSTCFSVPHSIMASSGGNPE